MKVTRGETSKDRKMDNRGDRSVFDRLDMGRSWNRAQDRLDRQERGVRGTNSESPRKVRQLWSTAAGEGMINLFNH